MTHCVYAGFQSHVYFLGTSLSTPYIGLTHFLKWQEASTITRLKSPLIPELTDLRS